MDAGTASRWLKADPPNLAEVWELLASIAKEGRRASDIIARIRALAKKDPIKMDRLNINDAIREVIALARTEITRKRVTLDARLADAAPVILGDRVQLQQVMLNLILNAVEAMSDGEPRELLIETRRDDGASAVVSVSDTGPGVEAVIADRVFEAFYSTKPGGMGIGLSICRSIIEGHGGKIWARPNEKRGSAFQFTIPIAAEPAEAVD
jgi:two-component system, LuxR family, sensor kinase FixL